MSKIGKISGVDWGHAPEGATHLSPASYHWRRISGNEVYYWNSSTSNWKELYSVSMVRYISKEEDLGMQKTVNDIEVGLFTKDSYGHIRVILSREGGNLRWFYFPLNMTTNGKLYEFNQTDSWSYTYDGPYTPFVSTETEEDKKLRELKETISQAQKQIDEIMKESKK